MKISIITVTYQAASTLRDAIESVLGQDYPEVEYLIIDGGSTDGTQALVKSYGDRVHTFVSEPDKGLYDAMNKGIALATGDIIGMLNADDFYAHPNILSKVVEAMKTTSSEALFGDLVYVREPELDKVVRYYPGKGFHPDKMLSGNMPPHPTFFLRKTFYDEYGGFDTSYKICADFDVMVRFFHQAKGSYVYLPEVMVNMRTGGSSTRGLSSTFTINREMLRACRKYGLSTSLPRIYSKYFGKVFQLIRKPKTEV
ncbi:MAG: glycosyltransferase [Bacteroidia bacterium]|nr:glycosyltransferase [Bacteroidia bacterium]